MTAHIRVREVGDEPATLSRALLTDLLRGELGFTGVAITDALEMKAISATVGVEQELSRHWPRAPTRSAWDTTSAPTRSSASSLLSSKASPRSSWSRRLRASPGSVGQRQTAERADHAVGADAAQRAVRAEGDVRLTRPAVVVELRPEPTIAVDARNGGLGDRARGSPPDTRVAPRPGEPTGRRPARGRAAGRAPARVAARMRPRLVEAAPDAIVVEVGMPVWRPDGAAGYVATHGSARVNVEAAVDRLCPS